MPSARVKTTLHFIETAINTTHLKKSKHHTPNNTVLRSANNTCLTATVETTLHIRETLLIDHLLARVVPLPINTLCCTVVYCTALYCTLLHCSSLHFAFLSFICTIMPCTDFCIQCCNEHCSVVYCTLPHPHLPVIKQ